MWEIIAKMSAFYLSKYWYHNSMNRCASKSMTGFLQMTAHLTAVFYGAAVAAELSI